MATTIAALIGLAIGAALVWAVIAWRNRGVQAQITQLLAQTEVQRAQDAQNLLDRARAEFGGLSQEALRHNTEQFLQLAQVRFAAQAAEARQTLEAKQGLIDKSVEQIAVRLTEVSKALQVQEEARRQAQGALLQRLDSTVLATKELQTTTAHLREALANPQRRGQWGERMAEDVLRLAGFIEGVNYRKQQTQAGSASRPDYTFLLPQDRCVNMDVKFPLPNYLRCLDATDETARAQAEAAFLRDVRTRVKEVTTREYIDPAQGTVDYVLVFIPNEQIYAFIHQHDATLLDDALRQKVVLCSPLTLYAILAVIRQAAENVRVEQAAHEILALLGAFNREWAKYAELMDKLGACLEKATSQFDELRTTRTRRLEKQLDRIETLRTQRQIDLPGGEEPGA
jgi:DNA recombination protein RmuC